MKTTDKTEKFSILINKYIENCGIPNTRLMLIIPNSEYIENQDYFNSSHMIKNNQIKHDIITGIVPSKLVSDWILVGEKGIVNL